MPAHARRLVPLLGLWALAACARAAAPPAPAATVAPERAVYAALLAHVFRGAPPDTVMVAESTVVFHAPELAGAVSEWRRQYEQVPAPLASTLAARSVRRSPTARLPLPRPVAVLGAGEMRALFRGGPGPGWAAFQRRYPRAHLRLGVSPVALSADGAEALIYYEYGCGPLCGGGDLVWLARGPANGWSVRQVVPFWVS